MSGEEGRGSEGRARRARVLRGGAVAGVRGVWKPVCVILFLRDVGCVEFEETRDDNTSESLDICMALILTWIL